MILFERTSDAMEIYAIRNLGERIGWIHGDDRPSYLVTFDGDEQHYWFDTLDEAFSGAKTVAHLERINTQIESDLVN